MLIDFACNEFCYFEYKLFPDERGLNCSLLICGMKEIEQSARSLQVIMKTCLLQTGQNIR